MILNEWATAILTENRLMVSASPSKPVISVPKKDFLNYYSTLLKCTPSEFSHSAMTWIIMDLCPSQEHLSMTSTVAQQFSRVPNLLKYKSQCDCSEKKVPVIGRKYLLGIKSATCHKEELSALKLLYIMDWRAFGSPQIPGTNLVPFHHYWERTSFTENKYYRNQELSATRNKSQTKRDMFWCFLPLTFL